MLRANGYAPTPPPARTTPSYEAAKQQTLDAMKRLDAILAPKIEEQRRQAALAPKREKSRGNEPG